MWFSNRILQLVLITLMLGAVVFAQSGRRSSTKSGGASSGSARRTNLPEPIADVSSETSASPASSNRSLPPDTPSAKSVAVKNTWQGITPLRSTTADVARLFGEAADAPDTSLVGPYRVEDGEVTFSYLTPSLAKLYRAPASMSNKVFTIYFKPAATLFRSELKFNRTFRVCEEQDAKGYYYLVNDAGIAYHIKRSTEQVETIIFQPARVDVRRLSVNTECVF